MAKLLYLKNIMVFFENALAINDLSLEVQEGEIVGILGPNSAGKTTLMNTISGLIIYIQTKETRRGGERITVLGELWFEGKNIINDKPIERVRKGIVLCRERHPIFPDSSVEENLGIAASRRRDSEIKKSTEFVYTLFPKLIGLRKRKAGFCSGGEQQMLIIGMVLMARPRLLLMDEPMLGLSPALQQDLTRAIRQIREEGITVLVAEQFARTLLPVIDRGYVIENGSLVVTGSGQDLLNNPQVKAAYFGV